MISRCYQRCYQIVTSVLVSLSVLFTLLPRLEPRTSKTLQQGRASHHFCYHKVSSISFGMSVCTKDWSATNRTFFTWSSNFIDVFSSSPAMESYPQQLWLHNWVQEKMWECWSRCPKSSALAWGSSWCYLVWWNSVVATTSSTISTHCYSDQTLNWQRPSVPQVRNFVLNGWSCSVSEELQPFYIVGQNWVYLMVV